MNVGGALAGAHLFSNASTLVRIQPSSYSSQYLTEARFFTQKYEGPRSKVIRHECVLIVRGARWFLDTLCISWVRIPPSPSFAQYLAETYFFAEKFEIITLMAGPAGTCTQEFRDR